MKCRYSSRCQGSQVTRSSWLKQLKGEYEIQLFNAKINCTTQRFHRMWSPIETKTEVYIGLPPETDNQKN